MASLAYWTRVGLRYTYARDTRVDFFLPTISLFWGVSKAQLQSFFEVRNKDASVPISENIILAGRFRNTKDSYF